MKVMVCLKQVPHQDARLDVKSDGSWIQEDNIKFEINSYDTYAVEEALRLKDKMAAAGGAEVVVVSIGPDRVTQALRTALGMGADRAIHVNDPAAIGADALGTAKILAAIAKAESADVIFAGLHGRRRQRGGDPADGGRAARHPVGDGRARDGRGRRLDHGRARARGRRSRGRRDADPVPDRDPERCQPGPLCVAQGHHAGEEEAGRREEPGGPRPRGQRRRREQQDGR
jgi:hypothetical protein